MAQLPQKLFNLAKISLGLGVSYITNLIID